jgi:hypothetical protein
MKLDEIINTLEMENELILFNPDTGYVRKVWELNDIDLKTYKAHCEAIKILKRLKQSQTVDAVPVVHAHWKYDPNGMDWNLGAWECSACGCRNNNLGGDEKLNPLLFAGSKYCPNCGAVMDESEGEHETD